MIDLLNELINESEEDDMLNQTIDDESSNENKINKDFVPVFGIVT